MSNEKRKNAKIKEYNIFFLKFNYTALFKIPGVLKGTGGFQNLITHGLVHIKKFLQIFFSVIFDFNWNYK